jgi:hypothetical protein
MRAICRWRPDSVAWYPRPDNGVILAGAFPPEPGRAVRFPRLAPGDARAAAALGGGAAPDSGPHHLRRVMLGGPDAFTMDW